MGVDKREKANRQDTSRLGKVTGRSVGGATFATVNGGLMLAAVHWMAEAGAAIRFGKTRDGGALAIGLYDGGEQTTMYLRPGDDVDDFLMSLVETYGPPEAIKEWRAFMQDYKSER